MEQSKESIVSLVLINFISKIEGSGCKFALIHQSLSIEEIVKGDVDIVLDRHPDEVILPIIEELQQKNQLRLIQRLHYEISHGYYYILQITGQPNSFLHLDCLYDPYGINRYHLPTPELLADREKIAWCYKTPPETETLYLTIKRAIKGDIDATRLQYLQSNLQAHADAIAPRLRHWFGDAAQPLIAELMLADGPAAAKVTLQQMKTHLENRFKQQYPGRYAAASVLSKARQFKRFVQPTGLFVVVLGPDGCGKSTLANQLPQDLNRAYRKIWQFHWRPGLLPKLGKTGTSAGSGGSLQPPTESSYRGWVSLARFVYYWLDFVLGYWLVIYPRKAQTTLVIGERYFPDVLVNPARYGFAVPHWLMRLAAQAVPAPDILILLSDNPAAIHARKDELTVAQIEHLLNAYRQELPHWRQPVVIDCGGGIDDMVQQVEEQILATTAARNVNERQAADQWHAFPSGKAPKLWVHHRQSFRQALALYHPYSLPGKISKGLVTAMPDALLHKLFKTRPDSTELNRLRQQVQIIQNLMSQNGLTVSFSRGTPGGHRKITAQVTAQGQVIAYVKIADQHTQALLSNEAEWLRRFKELPLKGIVLPELLAFSSVGTDWYLCQSAPVLPDQQRPVALDALDIDFLQQMAKVGSQPVPFSTCWQDHGYQDKMAACQNNPAHRLLWQHLEDIIRDTLQTTGVVCGPSHGDYAPWNTLQLADGSLYVFDWEYAANSRPVLFDLLHRVFMPSRLVSRQNPQQCLQTLLDLWQSPLSQQWLQTGLNIPPAHALAYIGLYFVELAEREIASAGQISEFLQLCLTELLIAGKHPRHQRKVLVSAYACEPDQGSEPGVGWRWVDQIGRDNVTWVITKKNNRSSIEAELAQRPNPNLHFEYVDLPKWASFWKKKQRGIRTYYYLWQFAALTRGLKLHKTVRFDLGHHVTFVNDWLWSFLALMPIPFVWGPIGSHPKMSDQLLPDAKSIKQDWARFLFQSFMRCIDPLYWITISRARKILGINKQTLKLFPISLFSGEKLEVQPAIAVENFSNELLYKNKSSNKFNVFFMGRFVPMKGPHLTIESFALFAKNFPNTHLTLIGKGPSLKELKSRVHQLGISDMVDFIDWLPRQQAIEMMADSDVFLFPSMEGGGMVVLEAMALGVPVICLDFGGPGAVIDNNCGIKVQLKNKEDLIYDISEALLSIAQNNEIREHLSRGAIEKVKSQINWDSKHAICERIYKEVTDRCLK